MDIYQPQCFPSENGNRAVAHRAPPLYMERGPGRVFFILTDAVGKAAWVTERALVQLIGPSATEVEDHQPNRTADRRIGPESWTKHVCPAIYGDLATDRKSTRLNSSH